MFVVWIVNLGIRQPIEEIGEVLKDYKYCFFHSDASQAIGKVAIDYQNVDLSNRGTT